MLKKCQADNSDPYLALLQYRNTAKNSQYSPAELLMSRSLRTKLPTVETYLKPRMCDYNALHEYNDNRIAKMTDYFNKNVKNLKPLSTGSQVMFKRHPDSPWVPGIVEKVCSEPRSYIVKGPNGMYRRNRQHILERPMFIDPSPEHSPCNPTTSTNVGQGLEEAAGLDPNKKYTRSGREIKKPSYYYDEFH